MQYVRCDVANNKINSFFITQNKECSDKNYTPYLFHIIYIVFSTLYYRFKYN